MSVTYENEQPPILPPEIVRTAYQLAYFAKTRHQFARQFPDTLKRCIRWIFVTQSPPEDAAQLLKAHRDLTYPLSPPRNPSQIVLSPAVKEVVLSPHIALPFPYDWSTNIAVLKEAANAVLEITENLVPATFDPSKLLSHESTGSLTTSPIESLSKAEVADTPATTTSIAEPEPSGLSSNEVVHKRTEETNGLDIIIQQCKEVLKITPHDHSDRAAQLDNLGALYNDRYHRTGNPANLSIAIQYGSDALYATSQEDRFERADRLSVLGAYYSNRHKREGALTDLEAAFEYHREALDTASRDHPGRMEMLGNLGIIYSDRYQRTGVLADLETAFQYAKEALDAMSQDDPNRLQQLSNLSVLYSDRYQRTGALTDLDAAIQYGREALDDMPYNHRPTDWLGNLAIAYNHRYARVGGLVDLELAIQYSREATDATSRGHPARGHRLGTLSTLYHKKFSRTGALSDLEAAFQYGGEALDATPRGHPERANRLGALSTLHARNFDRTGALCDLKTAIRYGREALYATPLDHILRKNRHSKLCGLYVYKYQRTGATVDFENAVRHNRSALDARSPDDPGRALDLFDIGVLYRYRYKRTGDLADFEETIQRLREVLSHSPFLPGIRLSSGRALLSAYIEAQNWPSAYEIVSTTVPLIPLLNSSSLEHSDRQHQVDQIIGLASDAAVAALKTHKPAYEAIKFLEIGRGIINGSSIELRTDVSALQERHPSLAKQFIDLRGLLDTREDTTKDSQRYNISQEFERVIEKIRHLPGFSQFLLAPSEEELREAATYGPIVVINVNKHASHALIIKNTEIQALELPLLCSEDVRARAHTISNPDTELLEWLWDSTAKPILDILGYTTTPKDNWPRIWWIPTGPLARFPIHAAGQYADLETYDTVMDRVISSYSSSVKTFIHSRQKVYSDIDLGHQENIVQQEPIVHQETMVLVGMAQTPRYTSLDFVKKEIEILADLGKSMGLQVKQPIPHQKDVLSAVDSCKIFHFAGHGLTDILNPLQSALILDDGRLTVENLFKVNIHKRKPFLAYLSACGTGQVKHERLIDEGLHLISAFQLAGFRHVIGTLWEVNDESCVDVARMTYEWMRKQGLSDDSVSEGLHHACKELRNRWYEENNRKAVSRRSADAAMTQEQSHCAQERASRPIHSVEDLSMYWIPYVHFGI